MPIPIFHKGEQVGEKRWYNDRLLMFILRHHMPSRYGADLPRGTRHPDTIAREAAENCPVCKERAEAEAKEAAETLDVLGKILKRYEAKVRSERQFRLTGRIVAADFTVRQLTHIELILACGGKTQEMIDLWAREPPVSIGRGGIEHEAHPISEELDRIRQKVWQAAGDPPRPRLPLDRRQCIHSSMCGGPTHMERDKARLAAEARMAEAQREWEATATEEEWAAWKAGGRRLSEA